MNRSVSVCLIIAVGAACSAGAPGADKSADAGAAKSATSQASSSRDGYRFTITTTTRVESSAPGASSLPAQVMESEVRVLGGKMRMDYLTDVGPMMKKGTYAVMDSEGAALTQINMADSTGVLIDGKGVKEIVGRQSDTKMDISAVSSRTEALGPGETILGFATKKYRVTNNYTLTLAMMGRPIVTQNQVTTILHVNEEIDVIRPVFQQMTERFAASFGSGDAMRKLTELNRNMPKGFALRQEQETRMVSAGIVATTHIDVAVTKFARGGVRAEDFVIPPSIRMIDMATVMREAARAPRTALPTP